MTAHRSAEDEQVPRARPHGEARPDRPAPHAALAAAAEGVGLRVLARGAWPEEEGDRVPPALAGFVGSSFSPLVAEASRRCLGRRAGGVVVRTGVVLVSALGDVGGAVRVAEVVDAGGAPGPLMFFQAVPNAVAGHVAARWGLRGPVVCVAGVLAGVEVAAGFVADGDADEVLVVRVEQAVDTGARDLAEAVLLSGGERP